jgi:hypothetical protein
MFSGNGPGFRFAALEQRNLGSRSRFYKRYVAKGPTGRGKGSLKTLAKKTIADPFDAD